MANHNLSDAKKAKNDEFYTQYIDIEKEINAYLEYNPDVFRGKIILSPCDDPEESNFTKYFAQNFEALGIKRFISTSYASGEEKRGKIFTLEHDVNGNGRIDIEDIVWRYLEGNGSYDTPEVTKLRDECDIIITNPPFSLFRDFLNWINMGNKQFLIIGNMNAITYKEVFPLIKENKMWLGGGLNDGRNIWYQIPDDYEFYQKLEDGKKYAFVAGTIWFTNLDHGKRHRPLSLMTEADNIKFSKHAKIKDIGYPKYDNYDAIEVCFVDAIPSDYKGVMGVPISFLSKYCPEQFEILGATQRGCHDQVPDTKKYDDYWEMKQDGTKTGSSGGKTNENTNLLGNDGKKNYFINKDNKIIQSTYQRIFIKYKEQIDENSTTD